MSRYWSRLTQKLEPYVPGEQPKDRKYIKLNTNENPYPPSPRAIVAINKATDENLRLYPDPGCSDLVETIAGYFGLESDQVFVGNGSDELLAFSFLAFCDPGRPILFPDITYSFYPVYCNLFNIDYITIPLGEDFEIPVEGFLQENGGIIIPNPNAPTGKCLSIEAIKKILDGNMNSVVIIDEAYVAFGAESSVKLINDYPNLLVIHTLSKSRSLAGLRVGFAMGHKDLIEALDRVKNSVNSYTLDRLALAGAAAAIEDEDYYNETRHKIIAIRERTSEALGRLGFRVIDSKANFIFVSHPEIRAEEIFRKLREKGILVRYFNKPRIDNFLRVTIGTDEEMDTLVKAAADMISLGMTK